jgi:hypothetical protein
MGDQDPTPVPFQACFRGTDAPMTQTSDGTDDTGACGVEPTTQVSASTAQDGPSNVREVPRTALLSPLDSLSELVKTSSAVP